MNILHSWSKLTLDKVVRENEPSPAQTFFFHGSLKLNQPLET